jgi:hypothetical protein
LYLSADDEGGRRLHSAEEGRECVVDVGRAVFALVSSASDLITLFSCREAKKGRKKRIDHHVHGLLPVRLPPARALPDGVQPRRIPRSVREMERDREGEGK